MYGTHSEGPKPSGGGAAERGGNDSPSRNGFVRNRQPAGAAGTPADSSLRKCEWLAIRVRPKPSPAEAWCRWALQPSRLYPKLRRLRPDGALFSERSRPDSKRSDCAGRRQPSAFETEHSLIRSARSHPRADGLPRQPGPLSFRAARFCKNRRPLRPAALPLGGVGARSRRAEMRSRADVVS